MQLRRVPRGARRPPPPPRGSAAARGRGAAAAAAGGTRDMINMGVSHPKYGSLYVHTICMGTDLAI
jgi:hypothetical protein